MSERFELGKADTGSVSMKPGSALIQGMSGSGKSWLVRRILEHTQGRIQQIILDPEGEFHTLREKYDYLLVSKEGELQPDVKTAGLLARKLMELGTSAIIDLYELKARDRKAYVRAFMEALVDIPKEFYHPCIVVLDEAHVYCSQTNESEATVAVEDICTRGRKRGFIPVLVTQRIAELSKTASAQLKTYIIGKTMLDIDVKRAASNLGLLSNRQNQELKDLKTGEFFCYGDCFSPGLHKVKVGGVSTSHPKVGTKFEKEATPTPEAIKKILEKLKDLPKEAQVNQADNNVLRVKVRELERKLKEAPKPVVDADALGREFQRGAQKAERELTALRVATEKDLVTQFSGRERQLLKSISGLEDKLKRIGLVLGAQVDVPKLEPFSVKLPTAVEAPVKGLLMRSVFPPVAKTSTTTIVFDVSGEVVSFTNPQKAIYSVLASNRGMAFSKVRVAFLSGASPTSSSFQNNVYFLRARGFIKNESGKLSLNEERFDEGMALCGTLREPLALDQWLNNLSNPERRIMEVLISEPGRVFSKEEVAAGAGASVTSSSFQNNVYHLSSLELLYRRDGGLVVNEEVL